MITEKDIHLLILQGLVGRLELLNLRYTDPSTETELCPQLSAAHFHRPRQMLPVMLGIR